MTGLSQTRLMLSLLFLLAVCAGACLAREPADRKKKADAAEARARPGGRPPAVVSPEVSADRNVTFRIRAPEAKEASVVGEISSSPVKMSKDDQDLWSATVGPLPPELYGYSFIVDGLRLPDPANPTIKPMRSPTTSILDIPGDPPLMHDFQNVPHGTVRVHYYRSEAASGLRRMHVYTPPDYDKDVATRFPTLYLFHGANDSDASWTVLGRAHWILDNLVAQGKAKQMVVVMPEGHARAPGESASEAEDAIRRNQAFQNDLLEEVLPYIEANYRVKAGRADRGIVGLSMGGGQSLSIGLNHLELFAYVGAMSASLHDPKSTIAGFLADPAAANDRLKLLWMACGRDDRLVPAARDLTAILKSKGIRHEYVETDGGHSWPVWRKYLAVFAPMLFVEN